MKRYIVTKKHNPTKYPTKTLADFLKHVPTRLSSLDLESTSLIETEAITIMFQVTYEDQTSWAIDFRDYTLEEKQSVIAHINKYCELVAGAHIKYDNNILKNIGTYIKVATYDVLDKDKILNMGLWDQDLDLTPFKKRHDDMGRFSLGGLMYTYFGETLDKSVRKNFSDIGDTPFSEKEWEYGIKDTESVMSLYHLLAVKSAKEGYTALFDIDGVLYDDFVFSAEASIALGDIEYNGIHINAEKWLKNVPFFVKTALELRAELIIQLKKDNVKINAGLFGDDLDVNFKSPKQLLLFFQHYYGITPKDSRGKPSTGKLALKELKLPVADLILKYRRAVKSINAFGQKFLDENSRNGRIHTNFSRVLHTFRVSSFKPNMQQIPHLKQFREPFDVEDPDDFMITADFPQQEPHISGHKTKDKKIKEFYLTGDGDMHSYVASNMLTLMRGETVKVPPKVDGNEELLKIHYAHPDVGFRATGKTLGLRMDYGGGPKGLSDLLKITLEEAKEFQDVYFKVFPEKLKYFHKMQAFALAHGFVYLNELSSIRRQFRDFAKYKRLKSKPYLTKKEKWAAKSIENSIKRLAINTPTQGTGAMMTKAVLIIVRRMLIAEGIHPYKDAKIKMVGVFHDEVVLWAKGGYEKLAYKILKYAMEKAALIFCEYIPMKVFPVVLKYWDH